jgi:nitrate reductase molybdenum cofactor assembly chaperone NarJ/NarW
MKIFRILSALLTYPTPELLEALDEIGTAIVGERLLDADRRGALRALVDNMRGRDLYDLQESYGLLFDRTRSLSLHLFEHVHGESRDRGQAMADLIALYRGHGFEPTASELPDFLPLFLEFLSLLPGNEAQALLAEPAGILQVLAERLVTRKSTYAAVFAALATLANAPAIDGPDTSAEDPDDLVALDAAWEEAAVHFGPGEQIDSCGTDRLRTRLRAVTRDAAAV